MRPTSLEALPFIVLGIAVAVLAAVLTLQYSFGLRPCELCLMERWPWYAAIALALAAIMVGTPRAGRIAAAAFVALFALSAAFGLYHVAVEQHWVQGPSTCTAPALAGLSIAEMTKALLATPVVRCDQVQWRLIGISLAGWNMIGSAAIALWAARGLTRREPVAP